jgi:hypothetical protein
MNFKIKFRNDETIYEYPYQHVIDNIPVISELTKDDKNENIIFENLDKNIFDAILNDNYESLIDPIKTDIQNIAILIMACRCQTMLGVKNTYKANMVLLYLLTEGEVNRKLTEEECLEKLAACSPFLTN